MTNEVRQILAQEVVPDVAPKETEVGVIETLTEEDMGLAQGAYGDFYPPDIR